MKQTLNPATHFAMLLMALAMSLAFLACEEKEKKAEAGTFKTVKIGNQTWMAENLNIETGNSLCYDNDEANCKKYGRLYDWNTAKAACPSGWHLPSNEEWENLVQMAGGGSQIVAAKKLRATSWNDDEGESGNGTDDFGFSALPGGYYNPDAKKGRNIAEFGGGGERGHSNWWAIDASKPCSWYMGFVINAEFPENDSFEIYGCGINNIINISLNYGYSVRCVQDNSGTSDGRASKTTSPSTDTDYSPALQTHYSKGTLGESGKTRPIEMFFQKVSKDGDSYSISGKSKTKAAEDAFSGTLSISSQTAGGSCDGGETELKGSYNLNEKESKTSGSFNGTFTACEKNGKLSKASFKGIWVKYAKVSMGDITPCEFDLDSVKLLPNGNEGCDGVKLLESIKYHSGNSANFEYDDKKRIVKIVWSDDKKTITLAYKGDDLVDIKGLDFKKNGNTITIDKSIITIDNDGYIVKTEIPEYSDQSQTYQYKAGNLIRISEKESKHEYKYDDKKSPFFNCKTPKWFLSQYHSDVGLKNNITEVSYIVNIEGVMDQSSYSFEYDSEGYPTKETSYDPAEDETITTFFKYRCVKE